MKGLYIRFDGPPGPEAGRFVEVERDGVSVKHGEWKQDGDYWCLQLPDISLLVKQLGQEGACRGCGKKIYWCVTKNGKKAPITEEGLNHFADCPNKEQFRT